MRVTCILKVKVEMGRWLPSATLAALAVMALWASGMGVRQLRQAIVESQDLYLLDIAGSHIESDLEFQIQQTRLTSVDASRLADENVRGTLQHLRQLIPPGAVSQSIQDFEMAWSAYS